MARNFIGMNLGSVKDRQLRSSLNEVNVFLRDVSAALSGNSTLTTDSSNAFVRVDGTAELTADWDAGSYKITAEQLESDVAGGTAPLVVASTTKVSNLNVELLDGLDSTQFLRSDTSDSLTAGTLTLAAGTTLDVNGTIDYTGATIATTWTNTSAAPLVLGGTNPQIDYHTGSGSATLTFHGLPAAGSNSVVRWENEADKGFAATIVGGGLGATGVNLIADSGLDFTIQAASADVTLSATQLYLSSASDILLSGTSKTFSTGGGFTGFTLTTEALASALTLEMASGTASGDLVVDVGVAGTPALLSYENAGGSFPNSDLRIQSASGDLYLTAGGGEIHADDHLLLADNIQLKLGTGQDAGIYYDGSNLQIDPGASFGTYGTHTTGLRLAQATKTTTYTIAEDDYCILGNHATTAFTVTLPAAGTVGAGKTYAIKNINAAVVTVDGDGSETIDGETDIDLNQWDGVQVISDGSNWSII